MKSRLSILSGLLFLSLVTFSQKVNLVVFSEDGYKFYAFVNGIKQNDVAESNVKITGVTPNISLRVEFEDKALPQLKQNMALEPGFEHTAKITRDMKKQLKLRYFGQVALNETSSNNVPTVAYHTAENNTTGNYNTATSDNGSASYTTTSTTTQINTASNPNGAAVNINVDGMSMNMNISGMDMNSGTTTSSSSTTVTSSSSSSSSSPKNHNQQQQSTVGESQNVSVGSTSCKTAMTPASFDKMKESVEAKPFSDTKMSTAKVATKNNCISVSQVKEICKLFSMDEDKLTYAKFAYDYCVDKGNYYLVSDVFSFSSTTDELNKFIEEH